MAAATDTPPAADETVAGTITRWSSPWGWCCDDRVLADLQNAIERIAAGVAAEWSNYVPYPLTAEEIGVDARHLVATMSVIKLSPLVCPFPGPPAGQAD